MNEAKTAIEFVKISEKNAHGYAVYSYFIRSMPDRETVGDCCLRVGEGLCEIGNIGYAVDAKKRCLGHATRACRLLLCEAGALGLESVTVVCEEKNMPSRRICEKLGGVIEGEGVSSRGEKTVKYKFFCKNCEKLWKFY